MAQNKHAELSVYDTTYILTPEASAEVEKASQDRIQKVITQFGGELLEWRPLGKKKLAYPIQKKTKGNYFCAIYTGKPGVVAEIERFFKINENVIRFLTMNLQKEYTKDKYEKMLNQKLEIQQKPKNDSSSEEFSPEDEEKKMMSSRPRKKECRLSRYNIKGEEFDYKDVKLLQSFMTEYGKIVPRRVSGNTAIAQRKLTRAIKRARMMSLLGYVTLGQDIKAGKFSREFSREFGREFGRGGSEREFGGGFGGGRGGDRDYGRN